MTNDAITIPRSVLEDIRDTLYVLHHPVTDGQEREYRLKAMDLFHQIEVVLS